MRSRYTAYVMKDEAYLRASWHPDTCPAELQLQDALGARTVWLGLTVKRHAVTGADSAEVEFIARYRSGGAAAVKLHEISRFVRSDGRWLYLDGIHR
ncbi:SEC-C motif-containing protein [Pseudoxanthomonas wuyuanensis]|uniref:SEC-C motif-containing protein n=2 Tax=Pseudoxanthomonas wuyuanensis TaxID=1073196 RepID=A0A286DFF7_9GAMM|nr:SEC-C motif-containing protein [Pseudoxanthomonas wuyuanensis]